MQFLNQPATIGPELFDRVSVYVEGMTRFAKADDFYLLRLQDDARKLANASPLEAELIYAGLSHIKGSVEDVRARYTSLLRRYPESAQRIGVAFIAFFCNLVMPKDARAAFLDTQLPVPLSMNSPAWVITSGSFQYFKDLRDIMEAKSLVNLLPADPEVLAQAQKILADHETSDDDCASIMDVVGSVMRDHKLFWAGSTPSLMLDEELGNVLVHLRVEADLAEIGVMNDQVFHGLMSKDLDRKSLIVAFKGLGE